MIMPTYTISFEIEATDKQEANDFMTNMGIGIKKLAQDRYKHNFLDDEHSLLLKQVEEVNEKFALISKSLVIQRIAKRN